MIWMNPYVIGLASVLVASAFAGTYLKGRFDGRDVCNGRITVMINDANKREKAEQKQANTAATRLEAAHAKTRVEFRTITKVIEKIVEKPVYRDMCLDDDGLRAVNAALAGSIAPAAQPVDGLPDALQP